jgi:acyl carrier protein
MTQSTPTIEQLRSLPWAQRREALEGVVVAQFRATLLMDEDEDLPLDESYFELGFTSLRISELKQRLEALLGCRISTTQLFNSPTVERLLAHVVDDGLPELFAEESDA